MMLCYNKSRLNDLLDCVDFSEKSIFSGTCKENLERDDFFSGFSHAVTYGMIAKKRQLTMGCRSATKDQPVAM